MYLSHCEIIEDFEAQIRKSGREPKGGQKCDSVKAKSLRTFCSTSGKRPGICASGAWGRPPPQRIAVFRRYALEGSPEKLIYREAYTTFAAEEVVERLTRGLRPATCRGNSLQR